MSFHNIVQVEKYLRIFKERHGKTKFSFFITKSVCLTEIIIIFCSAISVVAFFMVEENVSLNKLPVIL